MKTSGHVNHPETSLGSPESVGPREKVPQALCADQIRLSLDTLLMRLRVVTCCITSKGLGVSG